MTPDELKAIRERQRLRSGPLHQVFDDKGDLLAEVDRLTAENERLKATVARNQDDDSFWVPLAVYERLEAENKALAAVDRIREGVTDRAATPQSRPG